MCLWIEVTTKQTPNLGALWAPFVFLAIFHFMGYFQITLGSHTFSTKKISQKMQGP